MTQIYQSKWMKTPVILTTMTQPKTSTRRTSYADYPWASITSIEDPVTGMLLDLDMFKETYEPIMITLDAQDDESSVEFWLEPNPVNRSHLRFVNDQVKSDWIELAIAEACIPSMTETHEGESKADKMARGSKKTAPKPAPGWVSTPVQPIPVRRRVKASEQLDRLNNIVETIQRLDNKIAAAKAVGKPVELLEEKRQRACLLLNKFSDVTV